MLERFSHQARQVVVLAQDEARMLDHSWIGTEHLMLGLIGEGSGMAAQALDSLGISLEAARRLVEETRGRGNQAPSRQLRFNPRAKTVLEKASREAIGYDHIDTWHILLGLIRDADDDLGAMVLNALGADQNRVRLRVIQLLYKDWGKELTGEGSQLDNRTGTRLLDNPLTRVAALDRRLTAVERWLGMRPDLSDLGQQTAKAHPETEAVVDMEEFETATGLRGPERQRLAPGSPRQQRLERVASGRMSLARELGRVYAELDKLRAILRQHGIDPGDDPA